MLHNRRGDGKPEDEKQMQKGVVRKQGAHVPVMGADEAFLV